MKKKLAKITSALLSAICVFGAFGCGETENDLGEVENINEYSAYEGMHIYNKTVKAGEWFVKDGKTGYELIKN